MGDTVDVRLEVEAVLATGTGCEPKHAPRKGSNPQVAAAVVYGAPRSRLTPPGTPAPTRSRTSNNLATASVRSVTASKRYAGTTRTRRASASRCAWDACASVRRTFGTSSRKAVSTLTGASVLATICHTREYQCDRIAVTNGARGEKLADADRVLRPSPQVSRGSAAALAHRPSKRCSRIRRLVRDTEHMSFACVEEHRVVERGSPDPPVWSGGERQISLRHSDQQSAGRVRRGRGTLREGKPCPRRFKKLDENDTEQRIRSGCDVFARSPVITIAMPGSHVHIDLDAAVARDSRSSSSR